MCSCPPRPGQLAQGLCHDNDNIPQLEWGSVPEDMSSEEKQSEDDKVVTAADEFVRADVMMADEIPIVPLKDPAVCTPPRSSLLSPPS